MNLKSKLVERFLSDNPNFFKVLDLIGFILVAAAGFVADNGGSGKLVTITGAIGAAVCLISKFTKKDIALFQGSTDVLQTIAENLPELQDQFKQVSNAVKPILEVVHRAPEQTEFLEQPELPVDKPQTN